MPSPETAFRVLADPQRRLVVRCVQRHRTVALADVAEFVVERESGADLADVSAERVRDVYLSLYHTDVPKLAEAGFVTYDQDSDLVRATDEIEPALSRARDEIESMLEPVLSE